MFPTLEVKKGVKDILEGMFGEDKELGELVSDVALKGAPSRFLNVDISSRMGLSQLMGVSPYDGFHIQNLIGPTGSVFANLASGVQQVAQGDVGGGVKSLLPGPYKNALDLYHNQGSIRDKAGNLIYEPTAAEATLYVMGLRPKKLSDFRETQRIIERSENVAKLSNSQFFDQLAQQFMIGDVGGVRQALLQRQQSDPMFDAVSGARRVVEEVQKRTIPIDLARTGSRQNATERGRLTEPFSAGRVPEVQRLLQRKQMENQLLPNRMNQPGRVELSLAQTIDQLQQMNPAMSRAEAMTLGQRMMGRQLQPAF
jgi:hypothetical protein